MNIVLLGLYRVYQVCIMAPIIVVVTIVTALLTVAGTVCGFGRWWGYYPEILWARIFCWLAFVRVTVKGRENIDSNTSYVFVANHQGAYDIFTIYGYLGHSFRWMMKVGLKKIPVVGWACRWSGQIFVDNSSPAATRKTMEAAEKQLSGGMSLVVFPEGARTLDGHIHRFKKGAYRLAVEFGLPVVPLTIDGVYHVMPRTALLPRPGHIKLTIHKPIHPSTDGHDLPRLMQESFDAISSALPEANRAPAGGPTPAD